VSQAGGIGAELDSVFGALAELHDAELHALNEAANGVPPIAPDL
jgi:hypothetical protein